METMSELSQLKSYLEELRSIKDLNSQLKDELYSKDSENQRLDETVQRLENKLSLLTVEHERLYNQRHSDI